MYSSTYPPSNTLFSVSIRKQWPLKFFSWPSLLSGLVRQMGPLTDQGNGHLNINIGAIQFWRQLLYEDLIEDCLRAWRLVTWCQPVRNCHLEDILIWNQWDTGRGYRGCPQGLINQLLVVLLQAFWGILTCLPNPQSLTNWFCTT